MLILEYSHTYTAGNIASNNNEQRYLFISLPRSKIALCICSLIVQAMSLALNPYNFEYL
jgi:hypothetical protein